MHTDDPNGDLSDDPTASSSPARGSADASVDAGDTPAGGSVGDPEDSLINGLIDAHTHVGADLLFYLRGDYPYALDWPTLVRLGEYAGIRGGMVVFPMVSNLSMNISALREGKIETEGALEKIPYQFENRRMMEEIALFPELAPRAYPLWMIDPSREQAAQVEALAALAREHRCSGLKLQATIIRSYVRDLNGPGRCLMEYAEANDLPVLIHSSVHPEDPWSNVADLLAVAEAWPGIRFNLAHSCRFDKPSLDRINALPNTWFDCSAHRIHCELVGMKSPSVAAPGRLFPSDYSDPVAVLRDLAAAYPDKLMWGSDAPFDSYVTKDVQLRSSYGAEAATLLALEPEIVTRIARTNTLAFLRG